MNSSDSNVSLFTVIDSPIIRVTEGHDKCPLTDESTDKESTISVPLKKRRPAKGKHAASPRQQSLKFSAEQMHTFPMERSKSEVQMASTEDLKFKIALKRIEMRNSYQGLMKSTRMLADHAIIRFLKQYNLPLEVVEDPVFNRMLFFISTTSDSFHPNLADSEQQY